MTTQSRVRSGIPGLALVFVLAGCGSDADRTEETEADTTITTVPLGPVAADTMKQGQTANIGVVLDEWTITSADTLGSGQTQFTIVNRGEYLHGLELEGQGLEEKVQNIQPGGQATLTVNLAPGSYELYCPVEDSHGNHKAKGMRRTVMVR